MSGYTPWGQLPPDVRAARRVAHRNRAKLRGLGRPSMVDSGPSIERVRLLHDECGMSFEAIARAAGTGPRGGRMSQSTVSDLYRGYRSRTADGPLKKINRSTEERILAVPYAPVSLNSKALIDSNGTIRRLRALWTVGYGSKFQAAYIGSLDYQYLWRTTNQIRSSDKDRNTWGKVEVGTREKVKEMYAKLADSNPEDYGIHPHSVAKAKNIAHRKGWADPMCWDDDTIDDPDAFPEWTGECGTARGYYLHIKYDIRVEVYRQGSEASGKQRRRVLCEPCVAARTAQNSDDVSSWIDEEGVRDAVLSGYTYRQVAEEFDCSTMSVQRVVNKMKSEGWAPPKSGPRSKGVTKCRPAST